MEIWKIIDWIDGIPPIYEISNFGNVRSLKRNRMKQQQIDKDGYKRVMLYGKSPFKKFVPVHRLVAMAFISNPKNYSQVNHKDEDKRNNDVSNLEWCTCLYNNNYGTRNTRMALTRTGVKRPYMIRNEKGQFIGSRKEESE